MASCKLPVPLRRRVKSIPATRLILPRGGCGSGTRGSSTAVRCAASDRAQPSETANDTSDRIEVFASAVPDFQDCVYDVGVLKNDCTAFRSSVLIDIRAYTIDQLRAPPDLAIQDPADLRLGRFNRCSNSKL